MVDPDQPYRVHWDLAMPSIRRLRLQFNVDGGQDKERLLDALRELETELASDPLGWGEAKYEWKHLQMIACMGFSNRFRVYYGVHIATRQVFVREFREYYE